MKPLTPRRPKPVFARATIAALALGALGSHIYVQNAPVQIAEPPRPSAPEANGFPLLKAAGAKLTLSDKVRDADAIERDKAWTPARKQAYVKANAAALREARAALELPYCETNRNESYMADRSYYATFRTLSRAFVMSGDMAWNAGRKRDAANDYLNAVTIGRRVPHRSTLIPRLVGIACEGIGRRALWNRLQSMDSQTAAYTLDGLNDLQAETLPYSVTLQEEAYSMQNAVVELYSYRGNPSLDEAWGMEGTAATAMTVYTWVAPRPYVLRSVREHMDKLIAQSRQPYHSDHAEIEASKREPMTFILMPVLSHARTKYVANEAADNLLRTALALHVHKRRTGAYPAHLSELVTAKLLPAVPADPFAPPGTALSYRRLSSGEYQLYSVAADGVDDNGKGIEQKRGIGITKSRAVQMDSKGDMVAGWHTY